MCPAHPSSFVPAADTGTHALCPCAPGPRADGGAVCGPVPGGLSGLPSGLRASQAGASWSGQPLGSGQGGVQAREAGAGLGKAMRACGSQGGAGEELNPAERPRGALRPDCSCGLTAPAAASTLGRGTHESHLSPF